MPLKSIFNNKNVFIIKNVFFNIVERIKPKKYSLLYYFYFTKFLLFTSLELPSVSLLLYYIYMCCSIDWQADFLCHVDQMPADHVSVGQMDFDQKTFKLMKALTKN